MDLKTAKAIIGPLSKPSKMPWYAWGIPATMCKTGSKMAKIEGTVCSKCYALKGRYRFSNVYNAQMKRLKGLEHPQWVEAMSLVLNHLARKTDNAFFRWFDSGDLQSTDHLHKIILIARNTPTIQHWVATREAGMVKTYYRTYKECYNLEKIPPNILIRISENKIYDNLGSENFGSEKRFPILESFMNEFRSEASIGISYVVKNMTGGNEYRGCPSSVNKKSCEENKCRKCWGDLVVAYKLH